MTAAAHLRTATLRANLAALASTGQPFAPEDCRERVSAEVDWTREIPVARVTLADGSRCTLHSTRDPRGEARKWLEQQAGGGQLPGLLFVVGPGLGWVLDHIWDRRPDCRVVVLEPLGAIIPQLLSRRRFDEEIREGRLRLFCDPDIGVLRSAVRALLEDAPAEPPLLVNPVMSRVAPEGTQRAVATLTRAIFDTRANLEAQARFAAPYALNTLRNLHALAGVQVTTLWGRHDGRPGVVVGAGPSLDGSLEALHRRRRDVVLIAVDTALRPLLAAAISPDYVLALDPSPLNARHLAGVAPPPTCWLVAEPSVDPDALLEFDERVVPFRVGLNAPWPWLIHAGVDIGLLSVHGSVLTAATDFARLLGCRPIAFVGADLAYTESRPYCRGTIYEHDWMRAVATGARLPDIWAAAAAAGTIEVVDIAGNHVRTTPTLVSFRDWVVQYAAAHPSHEFVNCSPGGILQGAGIRHDRLDSVLPSASSCPPHPLPPRLPSQRERAVRRRLLQTVLTHLVEGLQRPGSRPPVDWVESLGLRRPDVIEAAERGLAWLSRPEGTRRAARHDVRPTIWPPEVAARLTFEMNRQWEPPTATPAAVPRRDAPAPASPSSLELLQRLLAQTNLLDPANGGRVDPDLLGTRPASVVLPWTDPAYQDVVRFEATLAGELEACGPQPPVPEWRHFCQRGLEPAGRTTATTAQRPDALAEAARCALWAEWLLVQIRLSVVARDGLAERWTSLFAAAVANARGALAPSSEHEAFELRAVVECERLGHAVEISFPSVPQPTLARITTGERAGTADLDESTPGRAVALVRGRSWPPVPRVLSGGALLPVAYLGSTIRQEAVFAPSYTNWTAYFDQRGLWTRSEVWPRTVIGQFATEVGTVAWGPRVVMFRPSAGRATMVAEVDFDPLRGLLAPDGSMWWVDRWGKLWTGPPNAIRGPVAAGAAACHIRWVEGLVVVEPVRRHPDGRALRERCPQGWSYDPRSGVVASFETDAMGQATGASECGGWTATAFVASDVVRLARPDGSEPTYLRCHSPLSPAWAGDSLLISTGDGDLLIFEGIRSRLA